MTTKDAAGAVRRTPRPARDELIEQAARVISEQIFGHRELGPHSTDIARALDEARLLRDSALEPSAVDVLAAVREKLGTPEGRAVSVHAAEVRAERDTWEAEYERVRDLKLTELADALAERDALQARLDEMKRSYELKLQDFARETARVSAGLRACTVTPTNEHVPREVVGEALLGWREAQKHIGDEIRNGALRAALQGDQPAEPEKPKREPCPEGWHYIGQRLTHCAECGLPPWEHAGRATLPGQASPFGGGGWVLKPWRPGEAKKFRARVLGETAEPAVTPPDPSGRITNNGPVVPFEEGA